MKKTALYFSLIFISLLFWSCEKVIDVDLETQEPKLVVESFINFSTENTPQQQVIQLQWTRPYFDNNKKMISGAEITLRSITNQNSWVFNETQPGIYTNDHIEAAIGERFELQIEHNQQTYQAEETLYKVPEIQHIEERIFDSFLGKTTEVVAYFQDNASEENYYFIQWFYNGKRKKQQLFSDEFFNGNLIDVSYSSYDDEDKVQPNTAITVSVTSLSKSGYNYLSKLLEVSANGGNPFASPMGVIRGNIKNITQPKDYPLGFFALTQTDTKVYHTNP